MIPQPRLHAGMYQRRQLGMARYDSCLPADALVSGENEIKCTYFEYLYDDYTCVDYSVIKLL